MPVPDPPSSAVACLSTVAVFLVIVAPLYLMLRFFVRLIRAYYGFDAVPDDAGPPLRVCAGCHNTVLEADFMHCPYCGRPLPSDPAGPATPPADAG